MTRRLLIGPLDYIAVGAVVALLVAGACTLAYLKGVTDARIAWERECRGFRSECHEARARGWRVEKTRGAR